MKIKIKINLPGPDFKSYQIKELFLISELNENDYYDSDVEWKVQIPDYIYDELADSEPRFSTKPNSKDLFFLFSKTTKVYKFQKTLTSTSISNIINYFRNITKIIMDRYSSETTSKRKVIFIKFNNENKSIRNDLNHAYLGQNFKTEFRYFIGFIYRTKQSYYGNPFNERDVCFTYIKEELSGIKETDKELHFGTLSDIEKQYTIIDYSEEREKFLQKIEQSFLDMNIKLNEFFDNLSNENIDKLIINDVLKLIK